MGVCTNFFTMKYFWPYRQILFGKSGSNPAFPEGVFSLLFKIELILTELFA